MLAAQDYMPWRLGATMQVPCKPHAFSSLHMHLSGLRLVALALLQLLAAGPEAPGHAAGLHPQKLLPQGLQALVRPCLTNRLTLSSRA